MGPAADEEKSFISKRGKKETQFTGAKRTTKQKQKNNKV
jgi:hypothetical protein